MERHRLQSAALRRVLDLLPANRSPRILHVAPEAPLAVQLRSIPGCTYLTADLERDDVDLKLDLTAMDMIPDASFDLVWASHVLEHIQDDQRAIDEISRILQPGGVAVLPVPLVAAATIDYQSRCEAEHGHVRAPGPDYFEKYKSKFEPVEQIQSGDVPEKFQTWLHEDRSNFPTRAIPERLSQEGRVHKDVVPICVKPLVSSPA